MKMAKHKYMESILDDLKSPFEEILDEEGMNWSQYKQVFSHYSHRFTPVINNADFGDFDDFDDFDDFGDFDDFDDFGENNLNLIIGTPKDNEIFGTSKKDLIFGKGGDDRIFPGFGDDIVWGGPGDDFIQDTGGTQGGQNSDVIFGEEGNDVVFAGGGNDLIIGGPGNDFLRDDPSGNGGNDLIIGGAGNDAVIGDDGDDILIGGYGDDSVFGGRGDDLLFGGPGGDRFVFRNELTGNFRELGRDRIVDFKSRDDIFELSSRTFIQLSPGALEPNLFSVVDEDSIADSQAALIVYSLGSGSVFYNENGDLDGFGEGGAFAVLLGKPTLIPANFTIR